MPTLFEQWLIDTTKQQRPQAQIPDWTYAGTAAAPAAPETPSDNASILSRIMSTFYPVQAVEGGIKGGMDALQEAQAGKFNLTDLLRPITGAGKGAYESLNLAATGNSNEPLHTPQDLYEQYSAMKDRPETQGMTAEQLHTYVKDVRHPEYEQQLAHMSLANKAPRVLGNLAATFGLDPMTYVGGAALTAPFKLGAKALEASRATKVLEEATAGVNKVLPNVPEGLSEGQAAAAVSDIIPRATNRMPLPIGPTAAPVEAIPRVAGPVLNKGPKVNMLPEEAATAAAAPTAHAASWLAVVKATAVKAGLPYMDENNLWRFGESGDLFTGTAPSWGEIDLATGQAAHPAEEIVNGVPASGAPIGRTNIPMPAAEAAPEAAAEPFIPSAQEMDNIPAPGPVEGPGINTPMSEAVSAIPSRVIPRSEIPTFANDAERMAWVKAQSEANPNLPAGAAAAAEKAVAEAPAAAKVEAGAAQEAAQRAAIPVANTAEEAVSKVGSDPASVHAALQAGAAEAIPDNLKAVQKAIEESLKPPTDKEGKVIEAVAMGLVKAQPTGFDVVANMALDKIGWTGRRDPFALSAMKVKVAKEIPKADGTVETVWESHTIDLPTLIKMVLSDGQYKRIIQAQARRVELTDRVTGTKHTESTFGQADADVLFRDPDLTGFQKVQKGVIDPWQQLYHRKTLDDPNLTSSKTKVKISKLLDEQAVIQTRQAALQTRLMTTAWDKIVSSRKLLNQVDEYENVVATWEARLAQARRAKKSTRQIKFYLNRTKAYWARTQGTLTREEAATAYDNAVADYKKIEEDIVAFGKEISAFEPKLDELKASLKDSLASEARKLEASSTPEKIPSSRPLKDIPDNLPMTLGTGKKSTTFGDLKDAIIEANREYRAVINLTRAYERGEVVVPGTKPIRPANVTRDIPEDLPQPILTTPYENVRDPIVQAANNTVLKPLEYEHLPVHQGVTGEKMVAKLLHGLKEAFLKTDADINTPQLRYGNKDRYERVSPGLFRRMAKEYGKPPAYYENIYEKAGGGAAGARALQDAGIPDVVTGSFTIEKQVNLAVRIKGIFHFTGSMERNTVAGVFNKPVKGGKGMSKAGLEDASHAAWDTIIGAQESYLSRGAKFITNYYPKDPQTLVDMIRVAAADTATRLNRDIHPSIFMTPITEKTAAVLDDPELVEAIKGFWESIPFISRNFDGAMKAEEAARYTHLAKLFPTIAKSQRFMADQFGIPTRRFGFNSQVPDWAILTEPGQSIAIQRAMSRTAENPAEAAAKEAQVASKAQEPVKDEHVALDEANGGTIDPPDQGVNVNGASGHGPNPGHGVPNSNSQVFSWIKQVWQREMGLNDIVNLVRDRNSYGKYVNTHIQNFWNAKFGEFTKEEIGQALIKLRHDAPTLVKTEKDNKIIAAYNEWLDMYFRGPDSVLARSGLTEEEILEYMPQGGGKAEFQQIMDPTSYVPPTMVQGKGGVHLLDDAPQVMSNMQNALTRSLAMRHYRGDVLAKFTSPVANGERTVPIVLNGKTVFTTQEIAGQYAKSESMLKEMLQYTPNGIRLIKELDGIQGIWKTMVTIMRPGHHVRNSLGNSFMLIGGLTHSAHAGQYVKDTLGMMRDYGNYGAMIKSERFASTAADKAEFSDLLATGRVAPRTKKLTPKEIFNVKGFSVTDQMIMGKIKEKGLYQEAEVSEDTERLMSSAGGINKRMMHLPYVRRMRQLSSLQEHTYRGAMFRGELEAYMKQGMSFEAAADKAAAKARRFYPDGLTLTTWEKNWARRFIPFYTYNRTIMGPLLEVALTKPHMAVGPLRAQAAVGQVMGGEDQGMYPDYLGAMYPTGPTYMMGDAQIGMDVGSQHLDAYKLFSDPGQQVASMISPFGAIPYSLMTGADQNGTPLRTGADKWNMAANNLPIFNSLFPAVTGHRVGDTPDSEHSRELNWINWFTGTKEKQLNTPKNVKSYQFQQRDKARNG